jgi:hypothetical protein
MEFWKKRLSDWRAWAALFLLALALYQAYRVEEGYALLWLKRAWKNRASSSLERGALYYFGDTGSSFLKFIDNHVPQDKPVIVTGGGSSLSNQNILKYFLFPRAILTCPCDKPGEACKACLATPDAYVPALNKFPRKGEIDPAMQFIPFVSNLPFYSGLYIPPGETTTGQDQPTGKTPYRLILALIIDLAILGGLSLLGYILARHVIPELGWVEALSLSVPLGAGLLTWFIFITSWIGIPIVLPTVILTFALLVGGLLWLRRRSKQLPVVHRTEDSFRLKLPVLNRPQLVKIAAWGGVAGVFLAMAVISVNRSYSEFDDIAIWSMKGYGIAYKGTIFATNYLGGHGLAYPLDLPLSIALFRLASGDVLPGSKFLFPIFTAAAAIGCYRFWRRWGVNPFLAWSGMLLLITAPEIFLHSTLGFANLPFAVYLVLGVFWSLDGLLQAQPRLLFMGGLLLAFAAWTRPEGILFAGILMAALFLAALIARRKPYFSFAWVLPLAMPVTWLLFAARYVARDQAGGALSALFQGLLHGSLSLAPLNMMLGYFRSVAANPAAWGFVFPAAALMLIAGAYRLLPRVNPPAFLLFITALLALLLPAGLFFVESTTEADFAGFLTVSFNRAYVPAAILLVAAGMLAIGARFGKVDVAED